MMTVIKIIFVLLLLIPVAVFIRFLLGRLTAEVPRQVLTPSREKLSRQEKAARKAAERQTRQAKKRAAKQGITVESGGRAGDSRMAGGRVSADMPRRRGDDSSLSHAGPEGYTPRRLREVHRSARVPFAAGGAQNAPAGSGSGHDRHRGESAGAAAGNSAAGDRTVPAKKNRARSEKQPTKRQLRKNRERARKRDRRRRIEAETEK